MKKNSVKGIQDKISCVASILGKKKMIILRKQKFRKICK